MTILIIHQLEMTEKRKHNLLTQSLTFGLQLARGTNVCVNKIKACTKLQKELFLLNKIHFSTSKLRDSQILT
jgi:hypothetical protein